LDEKNNEKGKTKDYKLLDENNISQKRMKTL
jgi:hypothetical protein